MHCSLGKAASTLFHHHPPCSAVQDISSAQDATSSRKPSLTTPAQRYVLLLSPSSPHSPCTKPAHAVGWCLFRHHTGQLSLSTSCVPALEGLRSTDRSQTARVGTPAPVSKLGELGHMTQSLCASGLQNGDKNIVCLPEWL